MSATAFQRMRREQAITLADFAKAEEVKEVEIEVVSYDYREMKAKELYDLCKERDIECEPKQSRGYYIDLLGGE